jgi:uncharacterized protein (DUF2147 family)
LRVFGNATLRKRAAEPVRSQLCNILRLDYPSALGPEGVEGNEVAMTIPGRTATALIASVIATSALAPARAADPMGNWLTGDKDSQVRITNCGGALCGNLVWLKEPNDPATGRPKTDKNNADAGKQNRPLLGVQIVLGMKPGGPNVWNGDVYNASDGKTYTGSFTMTGDDTAELKGCVLSFLCKSQTWTRVK